MIAAANALTYSLQRCQFLQAGERLGVFSFKKDRGYWIEKKAEDAYHIDVFGFINQHLECSLSELRAKLKTIISREFPRSNKLHVKLTRSAPQLTLPL